MPDDSAGRVAVWARPLRTRTGVLEQRPASYAHSPGGTSPQCHDDGVQFLPVSQHHTRNHADFAKSPE